MSTYLSLSLSRPIDSGCAFGLSAKKDLLGRILRLTLDLNLCDLISLCLDHDAGSGPDRICLDFICLSRSLREICLDRKMCGGNLLCLSLGKLNLIIDCLDGNMRTNPL